MEQPPQDSTQNDRNVIEFDRNPKGHPLENKENGMGLGNGVAPQDSTKNDENAMEFDRNPKGVPL